MIAYCGLDCSKCDAYIATLNNDQELRERTAKLWSKLNNVQILPEDINCEGCRADGVKTVYCQSLCAIRQCAIKNKVETCGTCHAIEKCEKIQSFLSNAPQARKNLKKI